MQTPIWCHFHTDSFSGPGRAFKGKGVQSQSWTYKGLWAYQGMSSSTLPIVRGQKKTMLEYLFHCLSPAHESLASASPALPSTNEWNCQRLKATTPLSETFPSIPSDRYLLSEISPFPLPSSLTTRRFLNFPSSIVLYLTFCILFAFGFGPRLVSSVFGSAGHGSWHPSSGACCIRTISCDWSPDMWETEMLWYDVVCAKPSVHGMAIGL